MIWTLLSESVGGGAGGKGNSGEGIWSVLLVNGFARIPFIKTFNKRKQLRAMLYLEQLALRYLAIMVHAWYKYYLFLAWIPVGWQSVSVTLYLCNLSPFLILPGQPGLDSEG